MIGRGQRLLALLVTCAFIGDMPVVRAQSREEDREYEIKAAYLYNFGLYVQWPKDAAPGDPDKFYIGVLGKNSVGPFLNEIAAKKQIDKKQIVVFHFTSVEDYKPCHILFLSAQAAGNEEEAPEDRLAGALKHTSGKPVLLVSESAGFAEKGTMIDLFLDDNKVKFEINPEAAKAAGLQVSSKLLRLGKVVQNTK